MKKTLHLTLLTVLLFSLCLGFTGCGFLNTLRLPPLSEQERNASAQPAAPAQQPAVPSEQTLPAESEEGAEPAGQTAETAAAEIEMASEPTPEPAATPEPVPEPAAAPEPAPSVEAKPDIDVSSFEFLLANSYNSIGMEYAPPYGSFEGQGIDVRIMDQAAAFLNAAREAGFNVWVSAALRNSEFLNTWFLSYYDNVYNRDPIEAANHFLAQGIDEHQTGLALDFTDQLYRSACYEIFDDPEMQETALYDWLVEHCVEYGFILRYPPEKQQYYGVACRHPAHFRYVGEEAARYITDNNLCLEEFLLMYEGNNVVMPKP